MADRADNMLVACGLAKSRERAKALIMEGVVLLDGVRVNKPSDVVRDGQVLTIKENPIPFVSRGGLKLLKAVEAFGIDLAGRVAADVGASTGGFTDCMLSNGAKKVFAIDVGYGQLDWRLRNDARVVCMERHNARNMDETWFDEAPSFASIDVSFISLKLILPPLYSVLCENGEAVALVKPQFEAGRGKVGKNGVVRDAKTHSEVLLDAVRFSESLGFSVAGIDFSPITGPKGNIEFLMYLKKRNEQLDETTDDAFEEKVREVVKAAHDSLD